MEATCSQKLVIESWYLDIGRVSLTVTALCSRFVMKTGNRHTWSSGMTVTDTISTFLGLTPPSSVATVSRRLSSSDFNLGINSPFCGLADGGRRLKTANLRIQYKHLAAHWLTPPAVAYEK
jgi:hypothetical protein